MTAHTIDDLLMLNRIAETLNRAVDVKHALQTSLERLLTLMGLQTGWIFTVNDVAQDAWAGRGYELMAHHQLPSGMHASKADAWAKGCDCQGLCNNGKLVAAYNEVRCSRLAALEVGDGVESSEQTGGLVVHASVPLMSGDNVLGILNVAACNWGEFDERALALLDHVGHQMGIALERARLYDIVRERYAEEQTMLLAFSDRLLGNPQLDEMLSALVEDVSTYLDAEVCAILLRDSGGDQLRFRAVYGEYTALPPESGLSFSNAAVGLGRAMQTQRPVLVRDVHTRPLQQEMMTWLEQERLQSVAIVPLIADGRSIGVFLLGDHDTRWYSDAERHFMQLMANKAAIALEKGRLLEESRAKSRIEHELNVGRQIQLSLLPPYLCDAPGWDFAAHYQAARQVGGDFYDHFWLPTDPPQLGLLVADVADKGVPAALFMVLSQSIIRTVARMGLSPAATLMRANDLIVADSHNDLFFTCVYAALEPASGELTYVVAGHNRPIHYHASDASITELETPGIILGVFDDVALEQRRLRIEPGDIVVFYSDGVTEAMSQTLEEFGEDRLCAIVRQHADASAETLSNAIIAAVERHMRPNEQFDDITLLVVRRDMAS